MWQGAHTDPRLACASESTVIQVIEVQQLHPPKRYHCLANNLEAVHRVRWVRRGEKWLALSPLLSEFDKQHPRPKPIPVLRLSDIA
jgi:hypothetical protein